MSKHKPIIRDEHYDLCLGSEPKTPEEIAKEEAVHKSEEAIKRYVDIARHMKVHDMDMSKTKQQHWSETLVEMWNKLSPGEIQEVKRRLGLR